MAWADVTSEVGLQNGKCCDKEGKSCLFRKISGTHKRLCLDLLFLCIRRLRRIRRRPRKRKNINTNTSTSSTILEHSIALAFALDVGTSLRLRCTCESVLNVEEPNQGQGIEHSLKERKALWHKTCRNRFSNANLERAKKRKHDRENKEENSKLLVAESTSSPVKARRSSLSGSSFSSHCFFCESSDIQANLHSASTLGVDRRVRECASLVNDNRLIGKLALGDMVAIEAKYHAKCLVGLYNQARKLKFSMKSENASSYKPIDIKELAFSELVAFTDESLKVEEAPVLKLSDLVKFYSSKLGKLGEEHHDKINATRLKTRVLTAFPDLTTHAQGREVLLVLSHEIGDVLLEAKNRDSEAFCQAKAAMIVRREILQVKNTFNGTFASDSQTSAIPASLKTLVDMIMRGATIKRDSAESQACLMVAQLLVSNTISRFQDNSGNANDAIHHTHHVRNRECPLPIYATLKIHGATREKSTSLGCAYYRTSSYLSLPT